MAIQKAETEPYWTYFLALEEDLLVLARYIEPSEGNFRTFSIGGSGGHVPQLPAVVRWG